MKKLMMVIVLLSSFLFNRGFSNDPDTSRISKIDSTIINLTFQNPKMVITDTRDFEAFNVYLKQKDILSQGILSTLNNVDEVLTLDQERRWESQVDYLSRQTHLTPEIINENIKIVINNKRILTIWMLFGLFSIITYKIVRITREVTFDWRRKIIELWQLTLLSIAFYLVYCCLLWLLQPSDYKQIVELLKLSSG
jgi:hypothetical protein